MKGKRWIALLCALVLCVSLSAEAFAAEMASIPVPMPYASWDFAEPNYGVTIEQYESLGIDVNDWYDAHGLPHP